ncbi:MAG TPA: DUF2127 domain-containing protein [Methylomirabilota bacterium]|jgi:uncharacterized membrane protein (DUF2068 family)|nr:DUF2127 domain-containing protein [Methylomirabilota bacterium]
MPPALTSPPEAIPIPTKTARSKDTALWLIGGFKLAKGVVLLAVGAGAMRLAHPDVADRLASWATDLHEHRYLNHALSALLAADPHRLRALSAGIFAYAALLLVEGTGLLLRKRWAEYFTVIATAALIPLELYELAKRVTPSRLIVIAVNVAIVWYLAGRLGGRRRNRRR